jgi:hypothetical protein
MQTQTNIPDAMEPPSTWHVEVRGERKGPMSASQVRTLLQSGQLTRDSLAWQPGAADWQPLHSLPAFAQEFHAVPPPLSGKAIPNGLVWTLAFGPLLGYFLGAVIAGIAKAPIHDFWWVTLILNIGLSLADEKKLKAAGYDTKQMGGAWLIPVYLYKRATVLKQPLGYFITWVVCFVLTLAA